MAGVVSPSLRGAHPNLARWTLGSTFAITYFVATLLRTPALFLMASSCVAVAVTAALIRRVGIAAVECSLQLPERATEGDHASWVLRVHNSGRLPVISLQAHALLGDWVTPVDAVAGFVGILIPGETMEFSGKLCFELRGRRGVSAISLVSEDPLGLWNLELQRPQRKRTLVLPRRVALAPRAREAAALASSHRRPLASQAAGGDFRGTREYLPGDSLRRVHWKWTARLNEYRVVEFEDDSGGDVIIALDLDERCHTGQGRESTIEYAVKITASLAQHLALSGRAVTIALPNDERVKHFAVSGRRGLRDLLDALAEVQPHRSLEAGRILASLERTRGELILVSPGCLPAGARRDCFHIQLDAPSFASESHARRAGNSAPRPYALVIRRGDDLRRRLEQLQ